MKLLVLDTEFQPFYQVDSFESFIWTDRYDECGDFELYIGMDPIYLTIYRPDYYLWMDGSKHLMIIESVITETDAEDGDHLKITGRSLESILDRRVVWGVTTLTSDLQTVIKTLLNNNIINPSDTNRKIENLVFEDTTDSRILSLSTDVQYNGETLYDAVQELCKYFKIGFRILFNENDQFVFSLYKGADRSYEQDENDFVVFSPKFDNLLNSEYSDSKESYKNVAYITGEGNGSNKIIESTGTASGMERREMHSEASSVSAYTEGGSISETTYRSLLRAAGEEDLAKYKYTPIFDAEIDYSTLFTYGTDYEIGDVVEVVDKYGTEGRVYVAEMIYSQSTSEIKNYPTFKVVEN